MADALGRVRAADADGDTSTRRWPYAGRVRCSSDVRIYMVSGYTALVLKPTTSTPGDQPVTEMLRVWHLAKTAQLFRILEVDVLWLALC